MPVTSRYPLNPCDYFYFAHHTMLQRRGQSGSTILMALDLQGPVESARLEVALRRVVAAYPVLGASARLSLLGARPYWSTADFSQPVIEYLDHRTASDWPATADAAAAELMGQARDIYKSPPLRARFVSGPSDQSRLCLSWPHAVMDAEGGQWLFREMDRLERDPASPRPAELSDDGSPVDPLRGVSWLRRIALFRRGLRDYRQFAGESPVEPPREPGASRWRISRRTWAGDAWTALRGRADALCPNGPARFSRFLAGCVLVALSRLHAELGRNRKTELVTLPMRCPGMPAQRPLLGNYLVSATLAAGPELQQNPRALMDDLARQLADRTSRAAGESNWAAMWMASWFREWQYRRYLSGRRGMHPYASGFSFYDNAILPATFLGAAVLSGWGTGTMMAPPGWNPVFSRSGQRLTLALAWLDGYHDAEVARRYADHIDAELLGRTR